MSAEAPASFGAAPYRRVLSYLRPHAGVLFLAIVATALFAVLDASVYVLLIPFIEALFVSGGGSCSTGASGMDGLLDASVYRWVDLCGDPLVAIGRIIILILLVFAVKNFFHFARTYLVARAEQDVNRDVRNEVYDHLVELDLAFFSRVRMGQIVSRLTTEVEQMRALVTAQFSKLVSALFEFGVAVFFMVLISWRLTLAAFVVIPGAMIIWGPLVSVLRRRDRRVLHLGGEVTVHVQETLAGIRLVKSSSAELREKARFRGLTADYYRLFLRAEFARALAAPMTEMLAATGTVILLWFGARLVVAGDLTGPLFVGFLALSMKLYAPVKNVAKFPATAQPGLVAAERVFEFLDAPVEIKDAPGARRMEAFASEIAFERVSFAYGEGESVLRDVSFSVDRGDVVALVGPSGAGKTTLVDLLGRFFDVGSGRITIDGVDIRDVRVADLRALMGVVSQETILFHDSVRANIAYGRPEASQVEIEAAAVAAHAHEFIVEMPNAYDTLVGERGVEVSGGQRQRLAIARALLRDPPILIFDEATSALDTASERLIQDATLRLMKGRTVFVIAHRLSTVQSADQILVMDGGHIVERGDHATLLAQAGLYRRLYDLQFDTGTVAATT
jgi:subfamily B ATP-binding cassette protein MsbA